MAQIWNIHLPSDAAEKWEEAPQHRHRHRWIHDWRGILRTTFVASVAVRREFAYCTRSFPTQILSNGMIWIHWADSYFCCTITSLVLYQDHTKKWFATKERPRQEQAIFSGSVGEIRLLTEENLWTMLHICRKQQSADHATHESSSHLAR